MDKKLLIPLAFGIFSIFSSVGGAYAVIKANDAVSLTKQEMLEKRVVDMNSMMHDVYNKVNEISVTIGRVDERLKNLEDR